MNTGPKTFLNRLGENGEIPPHVQIVNPSLEAFYYALSLKENNPATKLIARLDGACFYTASPANLYNFAVQRGWFSKPLLEPWFDFELPHVSKVFNNYLNRINKKLVKISDHVVFQSKLSTQMHERFVGNLPQNFDVIFNGVNIDEFTASGRVASLDGYPKVLISASLYRPHKRLQQAINFINNLSESYPNIKLHIIGDTDPIVRAVTKKMDTRRCVFHGLRSLEELPLFYRGADVMLSLAIFDPCPNVVVEALACGLPVITPRQSGASELLGSQLSTLSVDESISLEFIKFQTASAMPELDFRSYKTVFDEVIDRNGYYRTAARQRAVKNLCIKNIFRQYSKVWQN